MVAKKCELCLAKAYPLSAEGEERMTKGTVIDDRRPILMVRTEDGGYSFDEETVILPYLENGEMAPVLWLQIVRNGEIWKCINGKYVISITYITEEKKE